MKSVCVVLVLLLAASTVSAGPSLTVVFDHVDGQPRATFGLEGLPSPVWETREVFVSLFAVKGDDMANPRALTHASFAGQSYAMDLPTAEGQYLWKAEVVERVTNRKSGKIDERRSKREGGFLIDSEGVPHFLEESKAPPQKKRSTSSSSSRARSRRDVFQDDDVIVVGSMCVGVDCVNGENFGFSTIRLKENNLRLEFQDTSSSSSFPRTDWLMEINDSTNGGRNKFSIEDTTAGNENFVIMGGGRDNSIFVDDSGLVGFGTSDPAAGLHLVSDTSPTLMFEQASPAYTWELKGTDTDYSLVDTTNFRTNVLVVDAGAPEDTVHLASDGGVGFGTAAPDTRLHLLGQGSDGVYTTYENSVGTWRAGVNSDGDYEVVCPGCSTGFRLKPNGDMDVSGTVTSPFPTFWSDRNKKQGFKEIDAKAVLDKIVSMAVTEWEYTDRPGQSHIGPMAQDFYAAFQLGDSETTISVVDSAGVALAAVQGLRQHQVELEAEVSELRQSLSAVQSELEDLKRMVFEMRARV